MGSVIGLQFTLNRPRHEKTCFMPYCEQLVSVSEQVSLSLAWSESTVDRFSHDVAQITFANSKDYGNPAHQHCPHTPYQCMAQKEIQTKS